MAVEIERKFLVLAEQWKTTWQTARKNGGVAEHYSQGYISGGKGITVRARIAGERGSLTVKGPSRGIARLEFEYEIPLSDARIMLKELAGNNLIDKIRYTIKHDGKEWVVDEFLGKNAGLFMAEIELESEDEDFSLPPWLGEEVTGLPQYYNRSLSITPFSEW